MKAILLLMFVFLTSCAGIKVTREYNDIHPDLNPYVENFIKKSNGLVGEKNLKGLTAGFKEFPIESGTAGMCTALPWMKEIDIDINWWRATTSEFEREELVFHELGHCVLNRNHTSPTDSTNFIGYIERFMFDIKIFKYKERLKDGCPPSIMHPSMMNEKCIKNNYNFYLDELFRKPSSLNSCKKAEIINHTGEWTDIDEKSLKRAYEACIEKYNTCLKKFIKKEEQVYNAICGQ